MGLGGNASGNAPAAAVTAQPADDARAWVVGRLGEAGQILRRCTLPKELAALAGKASSWPDVLYDRSEHAAWAKAPPRPVRPGAGELRDLDEVLGWLLWLDDVERPIVFAKMIGFGFRRIAVVDPRGRDRTTLARVFSAAADKIVGRLRSAP